jgi:hypothetical protein
MDPENASILVDFSDWESIPLPQNFIHDVAVSEYIPPSEEDEEDEEGEDEEDEDDEEEDTYNRHDDTHVPRLIQLLEGVDYDEEEEEEDEDEDEDEEDEDEEDEDEEEASPIAQVGNLIR